MSSQDQKVSQNYKPQEDAAAVAVRDHVVISIAGVFRRYGYEAATMRLLSEESGLGRSSLYHHFPGGKEDMALAVLTYVEHVLTDQLLAPLKSALAPKQQIRYFLKNLDNYYESGELGCVLGALSLRDSPAPVADRVSQIMRLWISIMVKYLRSHGRKNAGLVGERIVRLVQGGLVLSLSTGDAGFFHNALKDVREILESE